MEVEKQFARDLDNNENVKLFVKLPSWFKVDTPIGPYNPDWAFVTEREEKLYFVRETKALWIMRNSAPKKIRKSIAAESTLTLSVSTTTLSPLSPK